MLVSRKWLEKFFDAPLPDAEALAEALTFHAFEIDGIERKDDDDVLDVKVTPNRGHDCLSHRGVAKELSAILKLKLAHDPFSSKMPEPRGKSISVALDTPLCRRYIAAHIKGVKVGESPKWLKERLEAIGQRSINNVVDATNFVMFNTGQPLHAFDAGKLEEKNGTYAIEVRAASAGEAMLALDGKEYALQESMLVISDANKGEAIGLAGVKGGMPSGISDDTADIIVESANFDGVATRKTAQALKLRTDASARFEQVISPELCAHGMSGMLEFVAHVTGGELVSLADVYPKPQESRRVSVTVEQVNKLLGVQLTGADVADVFSRLGLPYKEETDAFEVQPPPERLDLVIAEDLIEEVGRIVGYDKVPAQLLPAFPKNPEVNPNFYAAEKTREELIAQGYSEVYTSVFSDKGERTVLNKVDGIKPHLRTNLSDGLREALLKNLGNKELLGLTKVKLFEIGPVWEDGKEKTHIATLEAEQKSVTVAAHAWRGTEKELEPVQAAAYDSLPLSQAQRYEMFSRFPYIVRDVAMWTPSMTDEVSVGRLIEEEAGELCVSVSLFDTFQKGDKTSLAFRLIFQSFDRTLTDAEANEAMERVYAALKAKGFEIR